EPDPLGPALLMRDQAERLANGVVRMLSLDRCPPHTSEAEVGRLCDALAAAGFRVKDHADIDAFIAGRSELLGGVAALAEHLGGPAWRHGRPPHPGSRLEAGRDGQRITSHRGAGTPRG